MLATLSLLTPALDAQRGGRNGLAGDWINESLPQGVATAKRTGKPLMLVFRCPP